MDNMDRDKILTKLAEYDYPEWCKWVTSDSDDTIVASHNIPKAMKYYFLYDREDGRNEVIKLGKYREFNKAKPLQLFSIAEINQRKAEITGISKKSYELAKQVANMPEDKTSPEEWAEQIVNDWFPGREIVRANIMQIMPDRTHQKSCDECIYYEDERCVKETTNEYGHCPKWRKSR